MTRKTTLITDFDNTLYDWFHMWDQSFNAMLREIRRISGLSDDVLLPQIRRIHQRYGTSEYAYLIEELPALKSAFPGQDLKQIFDEAIHMYRRARKESLSLYPDVAETLDTLRSHGVLIVLYTDSLAYYTQYRVQALGLDSRIDFLFSPPDHALPVGQISHVEREGAALSHTQHLYLPEGVRKPDPDTLLDIVCDIKRSPDECIYVGDSLKNDIAMAQDAGIYDVLAEYGAAQGHPGYELLRKVSHWTDEDVERERRLSRRDLKPSFSITRFSDILSLFEGDKHVASTADAGDSTVNRH